MIRKITLVMLVLGILAAIPFLVARQEVSATHQQPQYPPEWEVNVPAGSRLAMIKNSYERRRTVAAVTPPTADLEDQTPLPPWFRLYMRDNLPDLPNNGTYQYPRVAVQILEWMLKNPNLETPPSAVPNIVRMRAAVRTVSIGSNINLTNFNEVNSESFIARDSVNPQFLIAASNNINGSGRQKQFFSSDSGATWSRTELPLGPGRAFNSDPALAFTSDGTAWSATLGIDAAGASLQVQVFKSTDHGGTWSFVSNVSTGNNNDKELMWIDPHPTSSFKDNIYVTWDVPGRGMRFARSTDKGSTWSSVATLSSDGAIGAHLTSGPSGELYVAWPDTVSRQLRIRKSTDGGATFAAANVIATTNDSFEISIPAMCRRKALIYLSLGVDRSNGPRRGTVYATWADRDGAAADPDCTGFTSASNTNIYFSSSSDGGATWAVPTIIHPNPASTDQFNQWMDVDPDDGSIHVIYHDTKDDSGRRKTNLYYLTSNDGGATWVDETKVSTDQTDETISGADLGNQYGDYNGLVAYRGVAFPSWTDRRASNPGGREQIYTARIARGGIIIPLPVCIRNPRLCQVPLGMSPGLIDLQCPVRPCMVIDPIPKNCLVKFSCPGCRPNELCPPFHNITLQGLGNDWRVGLVGPNGGAVRHRQIPTPEGLVVSFRPSRQLFQEGRVGDYYLTFTLRPAGKTDFKYSVKTSLDVSNSPFVANRAATTNGQPQSFTTAAQPSPQGSKMDKYPKQWEVETLKGTKLDQLRQSLEKELSLLPERDLEDQTPIPAWFRVYLRKQHKDLPTSGSYQYPKTASRILQQLVANPNTTPPPDRVE